jgi:uncharacterized protein YndB with AHSA1/START domain
MQFEQVVDIDRSAEEVFAYLADWTNIPSWNYYVQQVRKLTPGAVAVGTVYEQVRRTDRQRFQVTAHEPPQTIEVTTLSGERPSFRRRLQLRSENRGTRVHDFWELDTGHPSVVQRLSAARVRAAVGENLGLLKQLLEHGRVQLQDGRIVALDTNRRD